MRNKYGSPFTPIYPYLSSGGQILSHWSVKEATFIDDWFHSTCHNSKVLKPFLKTSSTCCICPRQDRHYRGHKLGVVLQGLGKGGLGEYEKPRDMRIAEHQYFELDELSLMFSTVVKHWGEYLTPSSLRTRAWCRMTTSFPVITPSILKRNHRSRITWTMNSMRFYSTV